jgi:hypothetical protein
MLRSLFFSSNIDIRVDVVVDSVLHWTHSCLNEKTSLSVMNKWIDRCWTFVSIDQLLFILNFHDWIKLIRYLTRSCTVCCSLLVNDTNRSMFVQWWYLHISSHKHVECVHDTLVLIFIRYNLKTFGRQKSTSMPFACKHDEHDPYCLRQWIVTCLILFVTIFCKIPVDENWLLPLNRTWSNRYEHVRQYVNNDRTCAGTHRRRQRNPFDWYHDVQFKRWTRWSLIRIHSTNDLVPFSFSSRSSWSVNIHVMSTVVEIVFDGSVDEYRLVLIC